MQPVALSAGVTVCWVLAGIIISLVLPLAVRTLRSAKLEGGEKLTAAQRFANAWTKYGGNR